jgi:hypothetical protein
MRRAPAVHYNPAKTSVSEVQAIKAWPKHCERPMAVMTHEQTEAAARLKVQDRVPWVAGGMPVLKRGGKHTWMPAISTMQVEESVRQVERPPPRPARPRGRR